MTLLKSAFLACLIVLVMAPDMVSAPLPGQVMVSPDNPAWFVYNRDDNGDGKLDPYFMCGAGGPEGFLYGDISNGFSQTDVINYLKQHGGNAIYIMAVRSHGGDGGATQNPWIGNNPANGLDQNVLNQWESWFDALEAAGIVIFFLFYDDGVGYIGGSAFITGIVNKFEHHKNLIWCIAEEYSEGLSASQVTSIAGVIRAADDYDHPVANHQLSGLSFNHAGTLNQFAYQISSSSVSSVHQNALTAWNNAAGRYNACSAEEHFTDNATVSDANLRKSIWANAVAGNYFMQLGCWETKKMRHTPPAAQLNYMRYLYTFMESIGDLAEMAPSDSRVVSGSAWALGKTGHYILYLPAGGNVTVNLSGASGSLAAEWYNPGTGQKQSAGTVTGGGNQAFSAPDNNDWVLHIGGTPPDGTPPSVPQGLSAAALGQSGISLSWSAASDNESGISGYEIYRGTSSNPTVLLATAGNVTSYEDNSCDESTAYYYRIKAVNGAGLKSGFSGNASATTSGDNTPPVLVAAGAMGDPGRVTVMFSETVEAGSAESISNYAINNGIQVQSAARQADGKTVVLTTTDHTEGTEYTLTVNNVIDASKAGNPIAANSTAAYTFTRELEITGLSPSQYRAAIRNPGDSIYIDRDYTFSQFWTGYQQDHYLVIVTANGDKASTGTGFLTFNVNMAVDVMVGVAGNAPLSWMSGWASTGKTVTGSHGAVYTLYSMTFAQGQVVLGGNEGSGANMYTVFVTPAQGPPVIHAGGPASDAHTGMLALAPNPFKSRTVITVGKKLQVASCKLSIFDVNGKRLQTWNLQLETSNTVPWNASAHPSGLYLITLRAGNKVYTEKAMLMK
jgi:hypothetical protein